MKKLLAISAIALLAGCACFECEEDYIEETAPVEAPANVYRGLDDRGCSYLTDEDCKRDRRSYVQSQNYQQRADLYVADYPQPQNNVAYREEINIQETQTAAPAPAPVPVTVTTPSAADLAACEALQSTSSESILPDGSPCPAKIRETREPVEIVYKKTTYKTVYEPKTTSSVTYEKEPNKPGVEIKATGDVETTVTKTTTTTSTTTTTTEDVLPAEEIK